MAQAFDVMETKAKAVELIEAWQGSINGSQAKVGYIVGLREGEEGKAVIVKLSFYCHSLKRIMDFRAHLTKAADVENFQKTLNGLEGMAWLNYDKVKTTMKSQKYL